jgi:thiosulfate dehydrogenase
MCGEESTMQRDLLPRVLCGCVLGIAAIGCGDDGTGVSGGAATMVAGDGVRGGALYDGWWSVTGAAEPTGDHPLWASRPDTASNTRTGADTWRCKECHGWDYKGVAGAYGSGGHKTGIVGVLDTAKTPGEILAYLKDPAGHAYGSVLGDEELANLAVFVTEWTVDTASYIDAGGRFTGTATAASGTFMMTCSLCHGPEGLNTMPPGSTAAFEEFPGLIANENPWEFLHKVRFGQPGTMMPPQAMVLGPQQLADLGAFVQTLPQSL